MGWLTTANESNVYRDDLRLGYDYQFFLASSTISVGSGLVTRFGLARRPYRSVQYRYVGILQSEAETLMAGLNTTPGVQDCHSVDHEDGSCTIYLAVKVYTGPWEVMPYVPS